MKEKKPIVDTKTLTARVIRIDDVMNSFMPYMPNPDEVLRDSGEAIGIYREMKSDSRIKSLLKVAKSAVLNIPVLIEQGDASDEVMDVVRKATKSLPFYPIEKRLLSAMDYGYAACELVWKEKDGWWLPRDVVLRKPERFAFDREGRLKYRYQGEYIDLYSQAYKWLVYRFDKDAENPYGTAALKSCYWPWKFKKAGLEFWLMATEKFAVPSLLAIFESSEQDEKVRERAKALAELLSTVESGSGSAVANVKEVKAIEASGDLSTFQSLLNWCDTQIAYGLVYQSLSVQEAENGTRAQATVHEDTFKDSSKGECRELAPVLQMLVDWVVELNFGPGEAIPQVSFDLADYATWEQVRDAIDRGVPVSRQALYSRYGLPEPEDDEDSFVKPPSSPELLLSDSNKKKARKPLRIIASGH